MFYALAIIGIIGLFFYLKQPKRLQKIMPYLKRFWNWILPDEWHEQQGGLTKSVIKALNDTSTLSKMILLHSYEQVGDEFGIYNLCTGRRAIGFKITPPPHIGDSTIKLIKSAFKTIDVKDVAVQISTYASNDISEYIEGIEKTTQEDINILNASSLKMMRDDRIEKMKKWANSSMLDNGADFRARNLISFMTIIFPKDTSISTIRSLYGQIQGVLTDINPEPLSPKLVVSLYGEIFKEKVNFKEYDAHQRMNVQLVKGARVRINNENSTIRIGDNTYAKVLTTNKYPKHTTPIDVQNAFFDLEGEFQNPLPCRFLTTLTVHIDNPERLKEKILKRARANVSNEKKIPEGTYSLMPQIKKTMQESHNIIQYIEEDKEPIYEGMYSLTIFENSPEKLDNAIGRIKTKFASIEHGGWEIAEEDYGIVALQVLLWSMPFQFDIETKHYLNRYNLMFSSNISAIIPLIGSFKGIGSPILRFFARSGQVVGIDLWASDSNYNACIIGPSGTGKSFLSNSIQASNAQAGVRSIIFDIGKSYKPLCDEIGGEFIHFSKENTDGSANKKCLNFFTNLSTEKVHIDTFEGQSIQALYETFPLSELSHDGYVEIIEEDAFSSIVIIVGAMCGKDLSMKDSVSKENEEAQVAALIEAAIQVSFYRRGREAGMRDIGETLKGFAKEAEVRRHHGIVELIQNMLLALEPYITEGGKFYNYYNGAYNINVKNDFCVVELEELAPKGILYFIVFMSMLERAAQEMFLDKEGGAGKRKSVIIDEAAPVLANVMFAKYLDDFARRVRKYNGSLTVITQNPDDFLKNVNAKAVWANTTHKFILELNSSKVEQNFADGGLFFGYGDFRRRQMTSVRNRAPHYSEVMYIYNDKVSEVLLLKATPQEAAMFTTNPEDKKLRLKFQKEYGLTPQESTKMLGYHKEGLEVSEILKRLKEGDRSSTTKFWMEKIRNAINGELIEPHSQLIVDESGSPRFYEVHLCIRDSKSDEIYRLKDFGEVAQEQDMLMLLNKIYLRQSLDFYSKKQFVFSFNISKEQANTEYLKNLMNILGDYSHNIIIEVPADIFNESKECKERAITFCRKAKEQNFMIAVDHLDFENFSPGILTAIEPTLLKIDGELIMAAQNNKDKLRELRAIAPFAKAIGMQILAAHIENEAILKMAKGLGFDFYQGHLINTPANMIENFVGHDFEFNIQGGNDVL